MPEIVNTNPESLATLEPESLHDGIVGILDLARKIQAERNFGIDSSLIPAIRVVGGNWWKLHHDLSFYEDESDDQEGTEYRKSLYSAVSFGTLDRVSAFRTADTKAAYFRANVGFLRGAVSSALYDQLVSDLEALPDDIEATKELVFGERLGALNEHLLESAGRYGVVVRREEAGWATLETMRFAYLGGLYLMNSPQPNQGHVGVILSSEIEPDKGERGVVPEGYVATELYVRM